jgi:predicted RNA binding protein YcfA (HicA-like mRNA interferase family)
MSLRLPLLSSKELCRFLESQGFVCKRQKGSHRFYRHKDGRSTVVPIHSNKDIKRVLLKAILDEIGMTREEFLNRYKR